MLYRLYFFVLAMFINKSNAFTLVELLVTVSIVGILAAISLANYQEYKSNVHETAAKSDLRNLRIAQEAYVIEHTVHASCDNATECVNTFPAISNFSPFVGVASSADFTSPGFAGGMGESGATYLARTCSLKSKVVGGQANSFFFFESFNFLGTVPHSAANCISMAQ